MSQNVICPGCSGRYHRTTALFDPELSPHGGMFTLKQQYKNNGWDSFPEHSGVTGYAIECPSCGAPYIGGNGRVKLEEAANEEVTEPVIEAVNVPSEFVPEDVPAITEPYGTPPAVLVPEDYGLTAEDITDNKIRVLAGQGKKPGEIAKVVGIDHRTVAAKMKQLAKAK